MTANFDIPNYFHIFCVEMSTTVNNSRAHAEPNLNILLLDISPLLPAPLHLRGRIPTETPEFGGAGKIWASYRKSNDILIWSWHEIDFSLFDKTTKTHSP